MNGSSFLRVVPAERCGASQVEENQERRFKEGWRGYGALDTHGPPSYAPGSAGSPAHRCQKRQIHWRLGV